MEETPHRNLQWDSQSSQSHENLRLTQQNISQFHRDRQPKEADSESKRSKSDGAMGRIKPKGPPGGEKGTVLRLENEPRFIM